MCSSDLVNGRIIDGTIVEVSLVDRPANPNAKLMLAKSVDGEPALVQIEEFVDTDMVKHPGHGDQSVHGKPRGGAKPGAGGGAGSGEGSAGGGAGSGSGSAGGGAGSSQGGSTSELEAKRGVIDANKAMNKAYDKIQDEERVPGKPMSGRMMDAAQQRDDAFGHTDDALSAIRKGDTPGAVSSLRSAADSLKGESAYKPAEKKFRALADKIEKNPLKKSTDADLRKALQSALQLLTTNKSEDTSMETTTVELPVEAVGDLLKFDKAQYEAAREIGRAHV